MHWWQSLWTDERGFLLSAEAVLLGTVGIIGATVGLGAVAYAVNEELTDVACAIRSLDQSYALQGRSSPFAWTAGSSYQQKPVAESLEELRSRFEEPSEPASPRDKKPAAKPKKK